MSALVIVIAIVAVLVIAGGAWYVMSSPSPSISSGTYYIIGYNANDGAEWYVGSDATDQKIRVPYGGVGNANSKWKVIVLNDGTFTVQNEANSKYIAAGTVSAPGYVHMVMSATAQPFKVHKSVSKGLVIKYMVDTKPKFWHTGGGTLHGADTETSGPGANGELRQAYRFVKV